MLPYLLGPGTTIGANKASTIAPEFDDPAESLGESRHVYLVHNLKTKLPAYTPAQSRS